MRDLYKSADTVLPNIISLAEENENLKKENNQLRIAKENWKDVAINMG